MHLHQGSFLGLRTKFLPEINCWKFDLVPKFCLSKTLVHRTFCLPNLWPKRYAHIRHLPKMQVLYPEAPSTATVDLLHLQKLSLTRIVTPLTDASVLFWHVLMQSSGLEIGPRFISLPVLPFSSIPSPCTNCGQIGSSTDADITKFKLNTLDQENILTAKDNTKSGCMVVRYRILMALMCSCAVLRNVGIKKILDS